MSTNHQDSCFAEVEYVPPPELWRQQLFDDDALPKKVDLVTDTYKNDDGDRPLPVVKTVERVINNDLYPRKERLPPLGYEVFSAHCVKILLGVDNPARLENHAFGIQTVSGTAALRIGAEFLRKVLGRDTVYLSEQTAQNHATIFAHSGFNIKRYRYWNAFTFSLDFEGLLEDLQQAPEGAVVLLQPSGHNPTGCDPSNTQWKSIAKKLKGGRLLPFFDLPYQGLATGDPAEDAWPVRYFAQTGFELFCAQSFSINFGLADERVGNLTVILKCVKKIAAVRSQFDCIVRSIYFSPPSRGARIISYILQEDHLRHQWKENLQILAARLSFVRRRLREELEEMEAPGKWTHITDQVGLFCYTGLNECHVKHLIKHHHIYMYKSGALAVTGLTLNNVKYIANGIKETLLSIR